MKPLGLLLLLLGAGWLTPVRADNKPAPNLPPPPLAVNRIRFFPAPKHEQAMVGGKFLGSNGSDRPTIWINSSPISSLDGFVTLAEIKDVPATGQWTELSFPNTQPYRWLIYAGPPGSHAAIAEIEFYAGEKKLTGQNCASFPNGGLSRAATDGDTKTFFEGLDVGTLATSRSPTLSPAEGEFQVPQKVTLACQTPGAVIRYTLDGTIPTTATGQVYSEPIAVDKTTTIAAAAFKDGLAPTPPVYGTYIIGAPAHRVLFQIGNSLTQIGGAFKRHAVTAGRPVDQQIFGIGGALTKLLWDAAQGNINPILLARAPSLKDRWQKTWGSLPRIDDFTMQPRDFNIAEEADYDNRFMSLVAQKSPDVQPWLYIEWTEMKRQRPTDLGTEPTSEMKKTWPAATWEESMAAMVLYGEDLKRKINETYKGTKPVRIIPTALAMGWLHHAVEQGAFPGVAPGQFYPVLFRDNVHPNTEGAFLVECTWYAALFGESPEGKVLPIDTNLTAPQAQAMTRMAWDAVKNYPDSGFYKKGATPCGQPAISPVTSPIKDTAPVTLSSSTPGAWFRYTLDGTPPTRTNGYIYCGVITVRPGMTLKAIAYKSGMADSGMGETSYPDASSATPQP